MDLIYIISCVLILPMFIYSIVVSARVNTVFNKYSTVGNSSGMTAMGVARRILDNEGLYGVGIGRVSGKLTDNYNPKTNTVYLSDSVINSNSVAAIGVAAHECGHAIQHAEGYIPIKIRSAIVPAVNFGTRAAFPLLIVGFILDAMITSSIGIYVIYIGLALYGLSTLFAFITLPCEFNASRRAKKALQYGILDDKEVSGATKVLRAAAQTYVASFAISLLMLIRVAAIFLGGRKRN